MKLGDENMLNKRQIELFTYLYSTNEEISGETLANLLEVTVKTINNDIKFINNEINTMGTINYKRNKGYKLNIIENNMKEVTNYILDSYNQSLNNRTELIMLLLAFEKEYIPMDQIAEKLYYSKTAISNEFENNWRIRRFTKVSTTKGVKLNQTENDIRLMLSQTIKINPQVAEIIELDFDSHNLLLKISQLVKIIFEEENIVVDGMSFNEFINYIFFMIYRIQLGFKNTNKIGGNELAVPNAIKKITSEIEKIYSITLNKLDIKGLITKLKQLNIVSNKQGELIAPTFNSLENQFYAFTNKIKTEFKINLEYTEDMKKHFINYMNSLYWRLKHENYHMNFFKREINKQSLLTTHILRDYFPYLFNLNIPDPELAYIISFFSNAIEKRTISFNLVLISDENQGLIQNWIAHLNDINTKYNISSIKVLRSCDFKTDFFDEKTIYLTTELKISLLNRNIIKINPIANSNKIKWVEDQINSLITQTVYRNSVKDKNHYLQSSECFEHPGGEEIDKFFKENHIYDYNKKFKIIINQYSAIYPSFTENEKTSIQIYHFQSPMKDKNRDIEYAIVSKYNIRDLKIHSFYELLKELLMHPITRIKN